MGNGEVMFAINEQIGVIAEYGTGWCKELNLISWNGGAAKFDVRDWNPDHDKMSKGITMHELEARKLYELLKARFEDSEC